MENIREIARKAKEAASVLAGLSSGVKNRFLLHLAEKLLERKRQILEANALDLERGKASGMKQALLDRLALNEKRIEAMVSSLRDIAALPDPVGEVIDGTKRPNGLLVTRVRVPLGVVAIIYEARPNVTIDSVGLCLKAGNAVVLRGSSSALSSNKALVKIVHEALRECGIPEECVGLVESESHEDVKVLLALREYIDVAIPRGGADLIRTVIENSRVPVIETGIGNCHVYVDDAADLDMAERIVINAKTQRPSVCNACETLLVHRSIASVFLPRIVQALQEKGVEVRGCEETRRIVPEVIPATEEDWYTEYLDLIIAIRVVASLDEAIRHINTYGSHHSDAIVTSNYAHALEFLNRVDSAAVFVNASTRFTDGGEFGMGAEIGISTQKLHARGPMGLRELTTWKFVVYGSGQIRE
jgi:glutamate-5-semialdehyde dehydrogenase